MADRTWDRKPSMPANRRLLQAWTLLPVASLVYLFFTNAAMHRAFLANEKTQLDFGAAPPPLRPSRIPTADDIVRKSYNEAYASLLPCPRNETNRSCMLRSMNDPNATHPWWFHTMIRDGTSSGDRVSGLEGFWHDLYSTKPPVRMCTVEKVGTSQWRSVFCELVGKESKGTVCRPDGPGPPPDDAPKFVFLRDPLERFLSAYIDKCINRQREKHCEPWVVFEEWGKGPTKLLDSHKKRRFGAYVDAMPLTWNLHFFPQSFNCDGLYRHIGSYDFVGIMGPNFYDDLADLGRRYGDNMTRALNKVFRLEKVSSNATNFGVETAAPKHVEEYYTARSVRKVLEYVSIDYVALGLPIPDWARRMLAREEAGAQVKINLN